MKYIRKIYVVYFYILFILIFLLLYPAFVILLSHPKRFTKAHRLRRFWGNLLTLLGGLRTKKIDQSGIQWHENNTFIVVANHSSYLDIISISCQVPLDLNFMAKNELEKIPVFGIFFRTIDIAVNRTNSMQSGKAYMRAKNQLASRKMSLAIFPEGGIKKKIPEMSPFKRGPFQMAIECGIPILPVVLPDNYYRGPGDRLDGTPGLMRTILLPPIPTAHLHVSQSDELKENTFQAMEIELKKYRQEKEKSI